MVAADSDILADRFWVRISDFFGQQTAMPFSDNGPFVANLIGTLAGGDALIGLRSRGDTSHPFILVDAMQSEAEAKFRQTQQALQKHLDDTEKQLRALRQGPAAAASRPVHRRSSRRSSARRSMRRARTSSIRGSSCAPCSST